MTFLAGDAGRRKCFAADSNQRSANDAGTTGLGACASGLTFPRLMTLFAKKVVNEQIGAELTESGKQGCRKCRATVKARLEMAAPPDQFGLRLIGSNQLSVPPELIEDKSKTLFQGLPMRAIALLISAVRPHAGKDLAIGSQLTLPTRLTGFKPQFAGDHFRIERPTHDSEFDRKEMPSHRNGFLFGVFRQIDAPSSPNWASKLLSPCAALPKGHGALRISVYTCAKPPSTNNSIPVT